MEDPRLKRHFERGIIPPLPTPLSEPDSLDREGLERVIEHVLSGGVHGLFVLGTTGEGPSLHHRLRHEVVQCTCDQVAGRVPVLVGITDTCIDEAVELAEAAYKVGAAAAVAAPPCYYPEGQDDVLDYFRQLADALPLPLMLYNIPDHTTVALEPETVKAAADAPGIVGIKDSSGSRENLRELADAVGDREHFGLFVGPEMLLAEALRLGARGGVPGGANVWPRLYVELYRGGREGDEERLESLHKKVEAINAGLYNAGPGSYRPLQAIKCALACMGICSEQTAPPIRPLGAEERRRIRRFVEEFSWEGA